MTYIDIKRAGRKKKEKYALKSYDGTLNELLEQCRKSNPPLKCISTRLPGEYLLKSDIENVEDTEKTKRERFIRELTNKGSEEDTTKEKTASIKPNSALNLSNGIITKYKKQEDEGLLINKLSSSSNRNISLINKIPQLEHKKRSISGLGIYPDSSADESMMEKLEYQFDLLNILITSNNYQKIEEGKPVIRWIKAENKFLCDRYSK